MFSVGCGGGLLLRIYTVESESKSHAIAKNSLDVSGLKPLSSVRFFFYPYVSDSVIHPVPEREFLTDNTGRAEYFEDASPFGSKMGALVAMKSGFLVDTIVFHYESEDTVAVLLGMCRR